MKRYPIKFVGAGPGDPELITVKGKKALQEADIVVYAGSLISPETLRWTKNTAKLYDSSGLTLEQTHSILVNGYNKGKRVVRLHSGDPSVYGAIHEQMVQLDNVGIPYEVIPGISAVFAAASKLKKELTVPEVSQTIIITRMAGKTPVPERESLWSLASHKATMALYLSISAIDDVVSSLLKSYEPDTPIIVAYRVGWPDEKFIFGTLANIAEKVKTHRINRQALILVGGVFREDIRDKRSKLYDPKFSHGFRKTEKA